MTELTPEEFANSFESEADESAVDLYLHGTDEKGLIELAVKMSPELALLEPEQLFDRLNELTVAANKAAARGREQLLQAMNFNTLMRLLGGIGYNLEMLAQERHITGEFSPSGQPEIDDPVKGPVFAMIERRLPFLPKAPERRQQLHIDTMIKTASARTRVGYPGFPCKLEPALRWAADAPDVPFDTLLRAFINFLETHVSDGELDSLNKDLAEYTRQLKGCVGNPRRAAELHREIKIINDRLAYLQTVKCYHSSFKPGKTKAPKKVSAAVKQTMASWHPTNSVINVSDLSDFAEWFYPFWRKHAAAYQVAAKTKSSINKISGGGGPISRQRLVWERRTADFIQFAAGRRIPDIGSEDWDDFFNEFAKSQSMDPRTHKKISGFIRTLLAQGTVPISDMLLDTIIDLLKAEKVNAVDQATIKQCLEILRVLTSPSSAETVAPPTDYSA